MAKVICAVLRYTEEEKSLIIEQEKIRQSVRENSIDEENFAFFRLAMDETDEINILGKSLIFISIYYNKKRKRIIITDWLINGGDDWCDNKTFNVMELRMLVNKLMMTIDTDHDLCLSLHLITKLCLRSY